MHNNDKFPEEQREEEYNLQCNAIKNNSGKPASFFNRLVELLPGASIHPQAAADRPPIVDIIHEVTRFIDRDSQFYGKLLRWGCAGDPLKIWHYGIGLSDKHIFDTANHHVFDAAKFGHPIAANPLEHTQARLCDLEKLHPYAGDPDEVISRLRQAIRCFHNWEYSPFSWNGEHLARLIATDDPSSYQLELERPENPVRNEVKKLIPLEVLQAVSFVLISGVRESVSPQVLQLVCSAVNTVKQLVPPVVTHNDEAGICFAEFLRRYPEPKERVHPHPAPGVVP